MSTDTLRSQLDAVKKFQNSQIAEAESNVEDAKRNLKVAEYRLNEWSKMIPFNAMEFMAEESRREASRLDNYTIDFVVTFRNYCDRYKPEVPPKRYKSSMSIIRMAESAIHYPFDEERLIGVKNCLEYQMDNIILKSYLFWKIPLSETRLFGPMLAAGSNKERSLLAESLISNIIAYRGQLDEHGTGLSRIILNDISHGFEWACYWIAHRISIDPKENDLISALEVE